MILTFEMPGSIRRCWYKVTTECEPTAFARRRCVVERKHPTLTGFDVAIDIFKNSEVEIFPWRQKYYRSACRSRPGDLNTACLAAGRLRFVLVLQDAVMRVFSSI